MEHEASLFASPETWVAVAFVLFVGLLAYLRVHKMLAEALDKRGELIAAELGQASRLKAEAEQAVAIYARKANEAKAEAAAIIAQAEAEAKTIAREAEAALEASIVRRTEAAKAKIAQAEAKAIDEVRAEAVRVATAAAERLIREAMDANKGAALIDQSIAQLDKTMH
jgi:F-type H+-transporting ATPase subunit b